MSITKLHISSPLEAGASLLDSRHLPPQLNVALEYVSSRLARKGLHLSLIVVQKDVEFPSLPSPQSPKQPSSPTHSFTTSPTRSLFSSAASNFTKALSRHSSRSSLTSDTSSAGSKSPSRASPSRTGWASLPTSPKDTSEFPPDSQSISYSRMSTNSPANYGPSTPQLSNPYGITLMHASTLTAKAEKILRQIIAKAEKKYNIGSGWLPPTSLTDKSPIGHTNDLIRRSLTQNEILFSSEGLTLLSLDHVYIFKCHLHAYSRSLTASDLTSAVDELQRLVLAQQGRRITKGYLMRAYDWMGVSLAALVDVNEGYKIAYGGMERSGGIEVLNEERQSPPPLKTSFAMRDVAMLKMCSGEKSPTEESASSGAGSGTDTSIDSGSGTDSETAAVAVAVPAASKDEVAFGETAHGIELEKVVEDRGPHRRGAVTPNGFEDITPVTRGSWCFLMVGEGWKEAKLAAVQTC